MDGDGGLTDECRNIRFDASGRVERGLSRVVPRFEAVHTVYRGDLHGGEGDWARATVDHGYGQLGAQNLTLYKRHVGVGEGVDHGAGERSGTGDDGDALGRAALGGFDDHRHAERAQHVLQHARCTQVTKGFLRQ